MLSWSCRSVTMSPTNSLNDQQRYLPLSENRQETLNWRTQNLFKYRWRSQWHSFRVHFNKFIEISYNMVLEENSRESLTFCNELNNAESRLEFSTERHLSTTWRPVPGESYMWTSHPSNSEKNHKMQIHRITVTTISVLDQKNVLTNKYFV